MNGIGGEHSPIETENRLGSFAVTKEKQNTQTTVLFFKQLAG